MECNDRSTRIVGVVLAGGAASRLGGGDKGLLQIGGRTILERVITALEGACDCILISANGNPARFASYGRPVVSDRTADRHGPLAGVLAGLDAAAMLEAPPTDVLTVPTDTPFLPADLVPRLTAERAAACARLACATSGGRRHPVIALWPLALRDDIGRALASGQRRIGLMFDRHPTADVAWPTTPFDPFFNVNTPGDLVAAETFARNSRLAPASPQRL